MDLEKFFDKVNHDILIDRLCKKNRRIRIYEQIQEIFKSVWNLMNRRVPNGTHGGVRGRRLVTASYSIAIIIGDF